MQADEALRLLEDVLKNEEIEGYKYSQLLYHSSLPLYANSTELPEPPEMPDWLEDLID
jgi:hypothetical protein